MSPPTTLAILGMAPVLGASHALAGLGHDINDTGQSLTDSANNLAH
jgi:predicted small secreted protein